MAEGLGRLTERVPNILLNCHTSKQHMRVCISSEVENYAGINSVAYIIYKQKKLST